MDEGEALLELENAIVDGHVALRVERDKRRHADSRILGPLIRAAREELSRRE
jgi:hypothetical protein